MLPSNSVTNKLRLAMLLPGLYVLLASGGCDWFASSPASSKPANRAVVNLKLLVVGDQHIAEAAMPLKAEWQARTGDSFEIRNVSPGTLAGLESLDDDAVIFPSGRLGTLVERGLIVPLSPDMLKNEELRWPDIFEMIQLRELVWGGQPHAVPFGSPLLVCWYRPELLDKLNRRPPTTWTEYQQLADFLSNRDNLGDAAPPPEKLWSGTLEPRAPGWAGRLLLARAAAYAKHRDSYSTFFNIDSMQPLVDGPPFVRALNELAAAARLQSQGTDPLDPAGVRREFLAGHTALALTWPTAADRKRGVEPTHTPVGFIELPGSDKVYSVATKRWEQRGQDEDPHMCFVGISGRLGAVSAATAYPDEALLLLAWLSGEWSKRVSAASPNTTLYRHSQLSSPESWVDAGIDPRAAKQYAEGVQQSLSRPTSLLTLRIPGEDEYFAALDEAVAEVVSHGEKAEAALAAAAIRWSEITQRLGHDAQRAAYRRSLGLEP